MSYDAFKGWLVAGAVGVDIILLLGLGLFVRISGPVRRLTRTARFLEGTSLDEPLGPYQPLGVMTRRLLYDLLAPRHRNDKDLAHFLGFTIGRLVMIVHVGDSTVKRIIREFRWYAFVVALLFLVGVLQRAMGLTVISIPALVQAIGKEPLHTLDLVAVAAVALTLLRLMSEIWRLAELLSPPD